MSRFYFLPNQLQSLTEFSTRVPVLPVAFQALAIYIKPMVGIFGMKGSNGQTSKKGSNMAQTRSQIHKRTLYYLIVIFDLLVC